MRFGIQSVGTLSGRSSRINAATSTFDVGRGTDELLTFRRLAHGEQRRSVRQPARSAPDEPGCARWLRCRNELTAGPVFCVRAITRQRITGHGVCGFKGFSESQSTVDVATTALINRKTSASGSGDYTMPPPINTSAEHKIGQYSVLPYRSKTYPGRLARFGNYLTIRYLAVVIPTKGRLAQFCYT
ncbi:Uncharacterized protein FWK35_00032213, partial [Aphis craccivora]